MRISISLVLLLAAAGCSDAPSKGDCQKLLDHTIRIELTENGGTITDEKIDAIKQALHGEFMNDCMGNVSRGRITCALKATTKQAIAACDEG